MMVQNENIKTIEDIKSSDSGQKHGFFSIAHDYNMQ